ncbi:GNAT family N-acetyltransferase [Microlunatus elymi]|uniref:GNAT family N-acetyltransferase n=1 Tax=Microlunatus elymi TaxID=2596828 RepID=A0A516PY72_9ACTN|nr:GNAT family N-acetyltransferase [Microlunatus elymi]QDP96116.1 GNAT family N-acetyltransferase [Microlunatus elymi]
MTAEIEQPALTAAAAPATLVEADQPSAPKTWRCAPATIGLVLALMVIIGIAVPAAAVISLLTGVTAFGGQQALVLSVLGVLGLLTLAFGWRLALHPRLRVDGDRLLIINPFRRHTFDLAEVTLLTPGGDGLIVGSAEAGAEAWCVQKPTGAIKAGRHTRADQVCAELTEVRDRYRRPLYEPDDDRTVLRFAHPGEEELLTELERSASVARLAHIFPPDEFPYPDEEICRRWQQVLGDRTRQTMIAEVNGQPVGYAAWGGVRVLHLGVAEPYQRQGVGSVLLEATEEELFADPSIPEIELWVLTENSVARAFYRDHGWSETDDERPAEFPPNPPELRMIRRNPHLARRSR